MEHLEEVTKVKVREVETVNQNYISQEVKLPSREHSQNVDSRTRKSSIQSLYYLSRLELTWSGGSCSSKQDLVPLNLERLQHWIDKGLIDPTQPITMRELYETRCVHGVHDGVKLLGDVSFPYIPSSLSHLELLADLPLAPVRVGRTILDYSQPKHHCVKSVSDRNPSDRILERNLHSTLREPLDSRTSLLFPACLHIH